MSSLVSGPSSGAAAAADDAAARISASVSSYSVSTAIPGPMHSAGGKLDERWMKQLGDVEAFHTFHARYPGKREPGGVWLLNQRTYARRGTLRKDRREMLDEKLPDWLEPAGDNLERDRQWLVQFLNEHGRLPRPGEGADGIVHDAPA